MMMNHKNYKINNQMNIINDSRIEPCSQTRESTR